ncbi:hypothetical protein SAMN05880582_11033 [Rhizobium sp. RU20A]|uniref:hypothetical protein n=1 Tax=Rhizobium sp. RU20A TaxID=1907412 RepID=UPI0009562033|nr:hypothetical protein [Rhizobium sp. RU20A]SIR32173.1 hypothetical protein SAMN05880582_11033 [Rhizobium sp. RU20A]
MPEDLPGRTAFCAAIPATLRADCAADIAASHMQFRRTLPALKALMPSAAAIETGRIDFMIDTGQACDIDSHDHFFRIRRSRTGAAPALLASQIQTLQILKTEVTAGPVTVPAERIVAMADAIRAAIAFLVGTQATTPTELTFRSVTEGDPPAERAMQRWVRGHQIFAGLCQSLVVALGALESAVQDQDDATVDSAGTLVASLLSASATALELTGDFPEARYNAGIRVAMDAPYFPTGFSGVLSRDHRQLVSRMKMMRPAIESLGRRHPALHASIGAALSSVYASHKHVCARFVEPRSTSLLMAATAERPATEQIDRFRAMRLRAWDVSAEHPGVSGSSSE